MLFRSEDKLTGMHANTQIPKVIGFKRVADLANIDSWNNGSVYFWENVTRKRSVAIGGNSVREHFHGVNDFRPMIESEEGPETCNSYNMLRLTKMFFESDCNERYADYYERTLYNHILSTINTERPGFVYFTPLRPGHYRVYSQPHTSFWCCVGSGLENHARYGEFIYAEGDESLYVNLYIPSTLEWKSKKVNMTMETSFPESEIVEFSVDPKKSTEFSLKLRYPSYVPQGEMKVWVNGEAS